MTSGSLTELVDAAWAQSMGCDVTLIREPGAHVVPGGDGFKGADAVYMVRLDETVLVYCPENLRPCAHEVLGHSPADELFTPGTVERIAGGRHTAVLGPAWHGFVDAAHFVASPKAGGARLRPDDSRLAQLREACGDEEWAEAGFLSADGVVYGLETTGELRAAGLMRPFRGHPADVGLLTHPGYRGQGLAKRLASRMISDALRGAQMVRYRALATNTPSLAVARSLGFVGRGENLFGPLREPVG